MRNRVFREGVMAAKSNGSQYKNPYPVDSREFNEYERGWKQGLRLYGALVEQADKKRISNEKDTALKLQEAKQENKEAYRRAKSRG